MYENCICQYKVLLFKIKHGQFAAVALSRSGATKHLKKLWETYVIKRDRVVLREHHKALNSQRRFESQLKAAQESVGVQKDESCYVNLAGIDSKV